MKVVLVGDENNIVRDITYNNEEENEITLNSFQQAAYWLVCIIREKLAEIKENRFSSQEETEFSKVFEDFNDICWCDLYYDVTKKLERNFDALANGDCIKQDTSKKCHKLLNEMLSEILCGDVPDIRLELRNNENEILHVYRTGTIIQYGSTNALIKLSERRSVRYNYVLTKDEVERKFLDTVRAVSVKLFSDDLSEYTANTICEAFCEAYIDYYDINHGSREKNKEFEEKLRREFLYTITELYGVYRNKYGLPLKNSINLDKIDVSGLDEYEDVALFIVEKIKERVYKG